MSITRISPAEAFEKMQAGYTYIDVRTAEEFADGRPAGAVNMPFAIPGPEGLVTNRSFVSELLIRFPPGSPIIVGCAAGARSMRAAEQLLSAGYRDIFEQRAGWSGARNAFGELTEAGWAQSELPSE